MKVIIAEYAGFCSGVKRAVQLAEDSLEKQPIRSLGPLIHNSQEIARLQRLGIHSGDEEILSQTSEKGEAVLIRSHGVGPQIIAELKDRGWHVIDATCPYVKKAQKLAQEALKEGYQVIILGNKEHAEVKGLRAWTKDTAIVVASWEDLKDINLPPKVAVLAQTTEKEAKFNELVSYLQGILDEVKVLKTICTATQQRQKAAQELATKVDLMLIIGGRHSSNTNKLWQICKSLNVNSHLIEEVGEMNPEWLKNKEIIGITAGASTPAWIIKEVVMIIEENNEKEVGIIEEQIDVNSNDDLLELKSFNPGDVIKGKVVKINAEEVLVDIGGKSEGIIPLEELAYKRVDPKEIVSEGQEISVEVLNEDKDGNIVLSYKKAQIEELLDKLEQAKESGEIITAPVIEIVKGGILVDVGIRGFVPASQVDRNFVADLNQYLNQELRMKVLELDRSGRKAVLSQRAVLEEEYQKIKGEVWEQLKEGQVRQGKVMRIATFGAFVDIGGIDGLLHVSEMAWGHISNPAEVVAEGDEIEVIILKIDPIKQKISLSLKGLIKNPWENAIEKYPIGKIVTGRVVRVAPFGAFIEVEPGIDGLAHISQLSQNRVSNVEEVLSVGQTVEAKVIENDPVKKRLSLSLKEIATDIEKVEYENYLGKREESSGVTIGEILKEIGQKL